MIKKKNDNISNEIRKKNRKYAFIVILLFGTLSIFATYAWFSTNLNVRVKTFNMIVAKNGGLSISFDGINFDTFVEISRDALIRDIAGTYPNNTSQWSSTGMSPVSSNGITNSNSPIFNMFETDGGVRYRNKNKNRGFINTSLIQEVERREYSRYIAFDLFFKNETGSPISDNLYLDTGTGATIEEGATEEMRGLLNSVRFGFVKIGSVSHDASVAEIQGINCNNNCQSIIYEPNSNNHTNLSIERARKYGINLVNGQSFPTYASIRAGDPIYVANTVSGTSNIDSSYFALQNTRKEGNLEEALFQIPDGITKARVYVWVEGQDIDSLETDSIGSSISISINFVKDTAGYN